MNRTTQIRKIVASYFELPQITMYNDKRKDGSRRLKFVGNKVHTCNVSTTIDSIVHQLKNANIDADVHYSYASYSFDSNYLEIVVKAQ